MERRRSYVYKIMCKITGEYYFGSSFKAKRDSYWGSGRKIKERIAQYGKENFIKEILEEFDDRVEAHKKETQYIEKFRNDDKCLNQQLDHKFGTFSDDTRTEISVAKRGEKSPWYGKHFSEEHRSKIGAANAISHLGKHHTEKTRSKISAATRGEKNPMYDKHHTEETKAKMSATHLGIFRGKHWRKNPITGKREWYD